MKAVITIEYEFKKDAYLNDDIWLGFDVKTEADAVSADVAFITDESIGGFIDWLRFEEVPHKIHIDVSA